MSETSVDLCIPVCNVLNFQIDFACSSLFTEHPEVQSKYFPMMSMNDVSTLGKHGTKVLNDVGILVRFVEEKNDAELVGKITKVLLIPFYLFIEVD